MKKMIVIESMKIEDLDEVFSIEENSFSIPWTKEDLYQELTGNKVAIYIVAKANGKVIGYAGMWHVITEGHITNIAVDSAYRRRGVGGMLLEKLLEIGGNKEMIGLTLEVRIGNDTAMRLYAKYGFKIEGLRKNYYQDTKEDAVIMWRYF